MLPIGELSRASGLTVSALRFYDREGLLVPADVDSHTGYRRYSPGQVRLARLLAGMRRVGMPLAEMAAVLAALPDSEVAEDLLTAHLRRLEEGLVDARREVERLQALLPGAHTHPWTAAVEVGELAQALDGVRFAVGTDPDFPMLGGVLCEPVGEALQLVATDRFRLAMAQAPATIGSASSSDAQTGSAALLPTTVIDQLRRALSDLEDQELVRLHLSRTRFVLEARDKAVLNGDCLDLDFPDYRRLLHGADEGGQSVRLPVADILAALSDRTSMGDASDRVVLHAHGIGDEAGLDEGAGLLLDRTFLWEAASAASDGHVVLPLGEQIAPLAFHGADDTVLSLLMPVRPEPSP
nr:MerR family transcriptional regulator [Ornithinimicrobium sp. HY1745]